MITQLSGSQASQMRYSKAGKSISVVLKHGFWTLHHSWLCSEQWFIASPWKTMSKALMATIPDATSTFICTQWRPDHLTPLSYENGCVWASGSIQDGFISISCITVLFFFSSNGIQNPIPICACLRDAYSPAHRPHLVCMPQLELTLFFLMDIVSFQDYFTCPMAHTVIIWGQCLVDSRSSLYILGGPMRTL